MKCREARENLMPYSEGDLDLQTGAAYQKHIQTCPDCRGEHELYAESMGMLETYETPRISSNFTVSLLKKIHAEPIQEGGGFRSSLFSRRALISGVAACLALLAIAALFWHFRGDAGSPAPIARDPEPVALYTVPDEEIIRDLEVYENLDLLENYGLLDDLDVIQEYDEATLSENAI